MIVAVSNSQISMILELEDNSLDNKLETRTLDEGAFYIRLTEEQNFKIYEFDLKNEKCTVQELSYDFKDTTKKKVKADDKETNEETSKIHSTRNVSV